MRAAELEAVNSVARAAALLDPLRLRILALAAEPASATEIATRLELPRQRVNYHVKELARHRFLRRAGDRQRGNLTERRYVATARYYALNPAMLGDLAADPKRMQDAFSAGYLLALTQLAGRELAAAIDKAGKESKRLSTLSVATEFSFSNAEERRRFAEALETAILDIVARFTSPPGSGRPYRLVAGCYPIVQKEEAE